MFQLNLVKVAKRFAVLLFCLLTVWSSAVTRAQGGESIEALKQSVTELIKQTRYTEVLPLLEKIVVAEPDNAQMHFYLGFALLAQGTNTKDDAVRRALRIRARAAFIRAKGLGVQIPVVDALIQGLPEDGSDGAASLRILRPMP